MTTKTMKAVRTTSAAIRSPSWWMLVSEIRWLSELLDCLSTSHDRTSGGLYGDGRPVLVIPGFLCSDLATLALRRFLRRAGYRTYRWKQGVNLGQRPGVRTRLLHRLNRIAKTTGQPVTLVGWSLGGVYARELACIRPDLVREVITLGSPWQGDPQVTSVWRAYEWLNRRHIANGAHTNVDCPPLSVPCLSIYSKGDGIVPWAMCLPRRGLQGRSEEVVGSHIGLIANRAVMTLIGRHLSGAVPPAANAESLHAAAA